MRTLTKSTFGSPAGGRAGMSVAALVTLASVLALALVVLLALSATPAQSAERNVTTTQVSGGKTLLKLDPDTAGALSDAGVKVEATGKATGPTGNGVFRFPIVGGKVDKDPLGGQIVHSGGLAFSIGSERLVVQSFVINLDRRVLTVEEAGTDQRIALLDLGAPRGGVKVGSERLVLRDVNAKLTAQAAGALNKRFDTELFEAGLLIGEVTIIAQIGDDRRL